MPSTVEGPRNLTNKNKTPAENIMATKFDRNKSKLPPAEVISFCDKNSPVTANGGTKAAGTTKPAIALPSFG